MKQIMLFISIILLTIFARLLIDIFVYIVIPTIKRRYIQYKKRKQFFREFNSDDFYSSEFQNFFQNFIKNLEFDSVPIKSFEFLGLTTDATKDDVQSKYRELSKIYHPDKGGSQYKFIELTEAKNKCLAYIK